MASRFREEGLRAIINKGISGQFFSISEVRNKNELKDGERRNMKTAHDNLKQLSLTTLLWLVLLVPAYGANDPSIKGDLRKQITASMNQFINQQTIDGTFYLYDAIDGKLLLLKFDALHEGIVTRSDFFISCADFTDQKGRKIDIDFLVLPGGKGLKTTQAIVHSVDGNKRKYHLESVWTSLR